MTSLTELEEQLRSRQTALLEEFSTSAKKVIIDYVREHIFNSHPSVELVAWEQDDSAYDDNDYYFEVGSVYVLSRDLIDRYTDEAGKEGYEDIYEYMSNEEPDGFADRYGYVASRDEPKEYSYIAEELQRSLNQAEKILELLGTTRIQITRNGDISV